MKDIKLFRKGELRLSIAWYDIWVGAFIDTNKKKLYICPIPFLLITISF